LRFREFTLDLGRCALRASGNEIRLRPKSFDVLRYLVEHPGRLVTRDELHTAVWGHAVVTDDALTQCLIDIRRATGDEAHEIIRTVPRRGFIFEAPVSEDAAVAPPDSPPSPGALPSPVTAPDRKRWTRGIGATVAAAVAVAIAAIAAWSILPSAAPEESRSKPLPNSIAVLPFVDMSKAHDQGYLADGISEEILNALAQSPELTVIARTSSFSFRGGHADIATIADTLNVAYVLEGSIRHSTDTVRVTAQLVDAATSTHLWSDTYDYDPGNILAVESDVATEVADALQVALAPPPQAGAVDPEAHELYLQGRFLHNRRAPGDSAKARGYFRRALDIDPAYGRAWAGLAGTFAVQIADEHAGTEAAWTAWREAVEQALWFAPDVAEVHMRAEQYYAHAGDFDEATKHRDRAMALDPNNPLVLTSKAEVRIFQGRLREAIALQQRAVALNPLGAVTRFNLALDLRAAGHFGEALAEARKTVDLAPSFAPAAAVFTGFVHILQHRDATALRELRAWPAGPDREAALAMIHDARGQRAEADATLASLQARTGPVAIRRAAEVHAHRGEFDEAFDWLHKGLALTAPRTWGRAKWIQEAQLSPFLKPLRDDPRWEEALPWTAPPARQASPPPGAPGAIIAPSVMATPTLPIVPVPVPPAMVPAIVPA
jgi:TolB-like protein/DNA-binding winged helix-turn-helix (wHTH) protein/Tfp pilus assembly protein PilF